MYRIVTDSQAFDQIVELPIAALVGYAEALSVLELVPWNGEPINQQNPDGKVRVLPFGGGPRYLFDPRGPAAGRCPGRHLGRIKPGKRTTVRLSSVSVPFGSS
jgi:hypothetical protein